MQIMIGRIVFLMTALVYSASALEGRTSDSTNDRSLGMRVNLIDLMAIDVYTPRLGVDFRPKDSRLTLAVELGMPVYATLEGENSRGIFASVQACNFLSRRTLRSGFRLGMRASYLSAQYNDYLLYERQKMNFKYEEYLRSKARKTRVKFGLVGLLHFKIFKSFFGEIQLDLGITQNLVEVPDGVVQQNFYNGLFSRQPKFLAPFVNLGINAYYRLY